MSSIVFMSHSRYLFIVTVTPRARNRRSVHLKASLTAVWTVIHRNLPNCWHLVSIQHHHLPFPAAPAVGMKENHRWHSQPVSLTTFLKTMIVQSPALFRPTQRMPLLSGHVLTMRPSLVQILINNHKPGKSIKLSNGPYSRSTNIISYLVSSGLHFHVDLLNFDIDQWNWCFCSNAAWSLVPSILWRLPWSLLHFRKQNCSKRLTVLYRHHRLTRIAVKMTRSTSVKIRLFPVFKRHRPTTTIVSHWPKSIAPNLGTFIILLLSQVGSVLEMNDMKWNMYIF